MKIILMRHGQAEGYKQPDSNRNLTDFGKSQAKETAHYIMDTYTPDMFVVSPYNRAKQTLEAYTAIAPHTPVKILTSITPEENASKGLDDLFNIAIDNNATCLLVVCHMPIVASMASLLIKEWVQSYSLAEVRVIDCEAIAENLGNQIDGFIPSQK